MVNKQKGYISEGALYGAIAVFICIGIAIGGVLFKVIPWLWSFIKPWLHSVTG